MPDIPLPLVDSFGRVHADLRISVTDRCNIRCFYCMPADGVTFLPRNEILSYEELTRFARIVAALGISKIRITGGEPLVRADLDRLVAGLVALDGIDDVAVTTNGMLLADQAVALKRAGLSRLNISLDTLRAEVFEKIARREGLDRVLAGIDAARAAGFERTRLNAVAIRGITEEEVIPLAEFARAADLELRFIEFMPLDAAGQWDSRQVLSGDEILAILTDHFGPLIPAPRPDASQPAVDYTYPDGQGRVGLINPVTQPFCGTCDRLRITADGKIRNCLFSLEEWDARELLRGGATDAEIAQLVRACVGAKKAGHGIDDPDFLRPARALYQIGG